MQHYSLSPRQLKWCDLLKISSSVKTIGLHALSPDSVLPPTLQPKQCKALVFICKYFTALWREGLVSTPELGLNVLSFPMCNSRMTQLTGVNPWNCASWKPAWTCPLAPVSAPSTCARSHIHADAFLSTLVCMRAGAWMHILLTHPHIRMQTHPRVHTAIPFLSYTFVHIHRPFWKLLFSERFYL